MMWECCRHLQKAQTQVDGSGPIRLGRQFFPFPKLQNPVIVALALAQGVSAYLPRYMYLTYLTGYRIVPSIAWMVEVCPCSVLGRCREVPLVLL